MEAENTNSSYMAGEGGKLNENGVISNGLEQRKEAGYKNQTNQQLKGGKFEAI